MKQLRTRSGHLWAITSLVLVLLCTGCAGSPVPLSTPQLTPVAIPPGARRNAAPRPVIALLLRVQSPVAVQRATWTRPAPTAGLVVLNEGDLVQVGPTGGARLLCADFHTVVNLLPGKVTGAAASCPASAQLTAGDDQYALPTRSLTTTNTLPYVTAPRYTRVLEREPRFSWNPVAGVQSYRVRIIDPDAQTQEIWAHDVTTATVRYDGGALTPERHYRLQVSAGKVTEESEFWIAASNAQARVAEEVKRINQTLPDAQERAFVLAVFYLSQQLYGDAVTSLDPLIDANPPVGLLSLQGQALVQMRWNARAQTVYQRLLERARADFDAERQLEATAWTARLMTPQPTPQPSSATGDLTKERRRLFQQASAIARNQLGDDDLAAQLEKEQP